MTEPHSPGAPILAWVDARNGVAGDMLLGALVDAGASLHAIQQAVDAVLPATVQLSATEVRRHGMRACKVDVATLVDDLPHRDWAVIRQLLETAPLNTGVRKNALAVFSALARAESRAHGVPEEKVHFHEVGAWDSIADVVGVCAGLDLLGVTQVLAGPVAVGHGTIGSAHGQIPVPVPAVLELSRGWSVVTGGEGELATPTGMALVATLAQHADGLPDCTVRAVGVGAGTRDDPDRPNVVRVVVAERAPRSDAGARDDAAAASVVLEANVDDLDPRVWPTVLADLIERGADDAWLTPILMKKGRPAHTLSVLVAGERSDALRDAVFALVPTLGIREHRVVKHVLARTWRTVSVDSTQVRVKLGHRDGRIVTATPEFADVVATAAATGRPVREVLTAATAAASAAGLVVGQSVPSDS